MANRRFHLRSRERLGKYRIEKRIALGPYAAVYKAYDTIEGIHVALKIPEPHLMDEDFLDSFRREVRLASGLDHEHILPIKNAGFIGEHFVITMPLGERSLADRLRGRIAIRTALDMAEQAVTAVAHAHAKRIIHCDIKPENFLLFPGNRMRLADFGIARSARGTQEASGSGTIGYVAPEQAMGHPSFRSDVFSLGLLLYRMFGGHLPRWPYSWPPRGYSTLRRKLHPDMIRLIQRAMELDPRHRYRDAGQMLRRMRAIRHRVRLYAAAQRKGRRRRPQTRKWEEIRRKEFMRQWGRALGMRFSCPRCKGSVAEGMQFCPWCGTQRHRHAGSTTFPARCPRCKRGVKTDWPFCAWCYGGSIGPRSDREYSDQRYSARCANPACTRKVLMPFMRYCPWCRRAVRRAWRIDDSRDRCSACGWGVVSEFWRSCPWCGRLIRRK